jgi:hypothetical protein
MDLQSCDVPPDPVVIEVDREESFAIGCASTLLALVFALELVLLLLGKIASRDIYSHIFVLVLLGAILVLAIAVEASARFFRIKRISFDARGIGYHRKRRDFFVPWGDISQVDIIRKPIDKRGKSNEVDWDYLVSIRLAGVGSRLLQHPGLPRYKGRASGFYTHVLRFTDRPASGQVVSATHYRSWRAADTTEAVLVGLTAYGGDKFCGVTGGADVDFPSFLERWVREPGGPEVAGLSVQDVLAGLPDPVRVGAYGAGCLRSLSIVPFFVLLVAFIVIFEDVQSFGRSMSEGRWFVCAVLFSMLLLTGWIFVTSLTRVRKMYIKVGSGGIAIRDRRRRWMILWEDISSVDVVMVSVGEVSHHTQVRLAGVPVFLDLPKLDGPEFDRWRVDGSEPYTHCIDLDTDDGIAIGEALLRYSGGRYSGLSAPDSYWEKRSSA